MTVDLAKKKKFLIRVLLSCVCVCAFDMFMKDRANGLCRVAFLLIRHSPASRDIFQFELALRLEISMRRTAKMTEDAQERPKVAQNGSQ